MEQAKTGIHCRSFLTARLCSLPLWTRCSTLHAIDPRFFSFQAVAKKLGQKESKLLISKSDEWRARQESIELADHLRPPTQGLFWTKESSNRLHEKQTLGSSVSQFPSFPPLLLLTQAQTCGK